MSTITNQRSKSVDGHPKGLVPLVALDWPRQDKTLGLEGRDRRVRKKKKTSMESHNWQARAQLWPWQMTIHSTQCCLGLVCVSYFPCRTWACPWFRALLLYFSPISHSVFLNPLLFGLLVWRWTWSIVLLLQYTSWFYCSWLRIDICNRNPPTEHG